MVSKATINRQKLSETVIAACNTHSNGVESAIGQQYGPEVGAAAGILVKHLSASLETRAREMLQKDDANEAELCDDDGIRKARDEAAEKLYTHLCESREQLGVICGDSYVSSLGFDKKTPADPVEILRLGEEVLWNLCIMEAPEPLIPGYNFDASIWEEPLTQNLGMLKMAITQPTTESKSAESALIAKREAIVSHDVAFLHTANLVSTLLEMSGEKEVAQKVRPSSLLPGPISPEDSSSK